MPVQDDARENEMISLFNLTVPEDRKRSDIDAHLLVDGHQVDFELKSTTGTSVSTVRDFGRDHITKWRADLHWIFAFYNKGGSKLLHCIYASPRDMEPWIADKESYVAPDLALVDHLPAEVSEQFVTGVLGPKEVDSLADAKRVMKKQWTADQYKEFSDVPGGYSLALMVEMFRLRARYVIERGSTLNNPHIPKAFFKPFDKITSEHASSLRGKVRDYLSGNTAATDRAT